MVVTTDRVAENLPRHERVVTAHGSVLDELLPQGRQVETTASVAANLQHLADGSYALHLVNYDYDRSADAVRARARTCRCGSGCRRRRNAPPRCTPTGGGSPLALACHDGVHTVRLDRLGVYSVVVLHDGDLP